MASVSINKVSEHTHTLYNKIIYIYISIYSICTYQKPKTKIIEIYTASKYFKKMNINITKVK